MILLDAVYINNGGGLVLLKYLVDYLDSKSKNIFYLFDDRTEKYFSHIPNERKIYLSNSLLERHFFYKKNRDNFNRIICFGNLPPSIRLNAKVMVYFHQPLFLNIPVGFSLKNKLIYKLKQKVLDIFKDNADLWLVQSNYIQKEFSNKYLSGAFESVIKLPFYPEFDFCSYDVNRIKDSFLYVSNSSPHKNHYNLIEAFCSSYDVTNKGKLTVTVPELDSKLCLFISEKIALGYPIHNIGFVDRIELTQLYLSHEYFIFPSLAESFGLGLAEAIDGGCKIIASNLDYTYEVCEPSLIFDPYDMLSIKQAIICAIQTELSISKKIIENDISKITQLLLE